MKIAGKDFRQRVVAVYQSGEFTREEVAKMFGYTTTTIGNWMRTDLQKGRPDHVVAARPQSAGVHSRGATAVTGACAETVRYDT